MSRFDAPKSWRWKSLGPVVAIALVAGCAGHSTVIPTQGTSEGSDAVVPLVSLPLAAPRDCKGQKKKGSDASATETLSAHGGSLCIPAIDGVGGALEYPGAKPSVKVTVTTTTKNSDHFPYPPNQPDAKAVIYLEIGSTGTSTTFGTALRSGAGVSGKGIKPHSTYTAYSAFETFGGFWKQPSGESTCFAVAKAGKRGGVIGLGSLLKGQTINSAPASASGTPFLIEIFAGQESGTTTAC
jgi:hypothetical protein